MQYIAEDPIHVVVRNEQPALVDASTGGVVRPSQRRVFAKFQRGTAPEFAQQIGLSTFEFRKRPEGGVSAGTWVAFYDSVEAANQLGWTTEEREAIDAKLSNHHAVVAIELPKLSPPWPKYDSIVGGKGGLTNPQVVAKIAEKVTEDGYDPAYVLAYETQERGRKSVLDALQKLVPAVDETADDEIELAEVIEA